MGRHNVPAYEEGKEAISTDIVFANEERKTLVTPKGNGEKGGKEKKKKGRRRKR